MNNITVAGQLGRDSEIRTLGNGDLILSFSVADSQGREKPTIWWNCGLFGKRAESLQKYLLKGQHVTVSGTVTEREWKDKDGSPRKSMEIRVNDVALQGGKKEEKPFDGKAKASGSGFDDMDSDIPY
jgi:single-strand DNA-binding protein